MLEIQCQRRKRLAIWIAKHHAGNRSAFARVVGKFPSQIADTLKGTKGFGERLAVELETRAQMPRGWLCTNGAGVLREDQVQRFADTFKHEFAQDVKMLAALDPDDRAEIQLDIALRYRRTMRLIGRPPRLIKRWHPKPKKR